MKTARLFLILLVAFSPRACAAEKPPKAPEAPPFDLMGYRGELKRWSAAAARLEKHPEDGPALRRELPMTWRVSVAGERYEVSTQWLRNQIESAADNPKSAPDYVTRIRVRLEALRIETESLAQPPPFEVGRARLKLTEILNRQEFRGVRGPTWFDRLRNQALYWIIKFLDAVSGRFRGHPQGARMFLWCAVIVAVGLSLIWLARLLLYRRAAVSSLEQSVSPMKESTSTDLLRQALAAARRENFRDAIRLAYWAAVHRLQEAGVWKMDRTRTHREYLRMIPAGHPDRAAVSEITSSFERVWYGGRAAAGEDFRTALAHLEKLGCLLPSSPATAGF